ncbi:MAG: pentapeptide repeat-containing protein [Planctomycetota bacterium]
MIDPALAPVRPRVITRDSGETFLLEDEVASLARSPRVGTLRLDGPAGSGKTTALRHLAATIDPELNVEFFDDADIDEVARCAESRFVVYSSRSRARLGMTRQLAAWTEDDFIEYLLSVRPESVQSVYARVVNANDCRTRTPELCRLVLDEFCRQPSMTSCSEAIVATCMRLLPNELSEEMLGDVRIRALSVEPKRIRYAMIELANHFETRQSLESFQAGLGRILRHRPVLTVLAAKRVVQQLKKKVRRLPALPIESDLVAEIASDIHTNRVALKILQRMVDRDEISSPFAATVLLACKPDWRSKTASPRLKGALLTEAKWNEIKLEEARLRGTDLTRADLSGATLDGVQSELAFYEEARFERARVLNSNYSDSDLKRSKWLGASVQKVGFTNADLRQTDFSYSTLSHCGFVNADLSKASFFEADLTGCEFSHAIMEGVDFRRARLRGVSLPSLPLRRCLIEQTEFLDSRLQCCDLENLHAVRPCFQGSNLRGAYLTGSTFEQADFRDVDLRDTGLGDIHWQGADLRRANLKGCSFHMGSTRSGLVGSPYPSEGTRTGFYTDDYDDQYFKAPEEIRKADLRNADLRGAKITGVDFYLVDLRGARYDEDQLPQLRRTGAILRSRVK